MQERSTWSRHGYL